MTLSDLSGLPFEIQILVIVATLSLAAVQFIKWYIKHNKKSTEAIIELSRSDLLIERDNCKKEKEELVKQLHYKNEAIRLLSIENAQLKERLSK